MMRIAWLALMTSLLAACTASRGFDRGALRAQATVQREVTDEDIAKVLALKPQLPERFRLAVYFVPREAADWRSHSAFWNWTGKDKNEMLAMAGALKGKGIVADVYVLPDTVVEGSGRKAIRLGAARSGADAVLIVGGAADLDRYNNELGYSYVLLVTAFFIPGTVADGIFMANASMWDVRNDYLYLSAESEGTASQTAPSVFIDEDPIIAQAKDEAVRQLREKVSAQLLHIGSAPRN